MRLRRILRVAGIFAVFVGTAIHLHAASFDDTATHELLSQYNYDFVHALDVGGSENDPARYSLTTDDDLRDIFSVGYDTAYNTLTLANAALSDTEGSIGAWRGADHNAVILTGNATWTNTVSLTIGNEGARNSLTISSGAVLVTKEADEPLATGNVSIGIAPGADGNAVNLSGSDSSLSYAGSLTLGTFGSGNSLTVSAGAQLAVIDDKAEKQDEETDTGTYIGVYSDDNTVLLTGSGTTWNALSSYKDSPGNVVVGVNGSHNSLTIADGAHMYADARKRALIVGQGVSATSNTLTLTGSGSTLETQALTIGESGSHNSMLISDGAVFTNSNANSGIVTLGLNSNANDNSLTIDNATFNGKITIGNGGAYNSLIIQNGGKAYLTSNKISFNQDTTIGALTGADHNSLLITGTGSSFTGGGLTVGQNGSYNSIVVENGGTLSTGNRSGAIGSYRTVTIGALNGGTSPLTGLWIPYAEGNTVLVTGTGSTWTQLGDLNIGSGGRDNSLTVADGGTVTTGGNTYLSYYGASYANKAIVTGTGSAWTVNGALYLGYSGTDSELTVISGGRLNTTDTYLGYNLNTASGNSARVSGATWNNTGSLTVGHASANNSLRVENGGQLTSGSTVIGNRQGYYRYHYNGSTYVHSELEYANNNSAGITGSSSTWALTGDLTVGLGGRGNTLTITDGAHVSSINGSIGTLTSTFTADIDHEEGYTITHAANDNSVLLSGTGSRWTNTGDLSIGTTGTYDADIAEKLGNDGYTGSTGNTLTLTDYALVTVGGDFSIAEGNFLRLDGGYLAWFGDHVSDLESLISNGLVQVLAGEEAWITQTSLTSYTIAYHESEDFDTGALTAGHYTDLGGYTLLSTAVPEPALSAALLGFTSLLWVSRRRKAAAPVA
jgi:T5SS/PEP-CTERM-associated repeat protein